MSGDGERMSGPAGRASDRQQRLRRGEGARVGLVRGLGVADIERELRPRRR